jgi:divinyl chlorophyllide a 8-vinyl-reductase
MKTRQSASFASILAVGALLCAQVDAFSLQMQAGKTNVIAGASGYIGKSTVRESVRQGYKTIALVRDKSKVESKEGKMLYGQFFEDAEVVECDVTNPAQLTKVRREICISMIVIKA